MRLSLQVGVVLMVLLFIPRGRAQNLLPNPDFEKGSEQVAGWGLADGGGEWTRAAHAGGRALAVSGSGGDQSVWRTDRLPFKPGGLYRLRFFGRRDAGSGGGGAVSGTSRVNRDFRLSDQWEEKSYVFVTPAEITADYIRLGQWHVRGGMAFDDVELVPVMALHSRVAEGLELGEAESIRGGVYRFNPNFAWPGATYHRPLLSQRAGFNSDRWLFSPGAEVIYRLAVPGYVQESARLRLAINYHTGGALQVEAGPDGKAWQVVTNLDGERRSGEVMLPAGLFPAAEVFVRLTQPGVGSGFQVNRFDYQAKLVGAAPEAEGQTQFLDVQASAPELAVNWKSLERDDGGGRWQLELALTNLTSAPLEVRGLAGLEADGLPDRTGGETLVLGESGSMKLSCPLGGVGPQVIRVQLQDSAGRSLFAGRVETRLGFLSDLRPGHWLAEADHVGVWWCESGWKP